MRKNIKIFVGTAGGAADGQPRYEDPRFIRHYRKNGMKKQW